MKRLKSLGMVLAFLLCAQGAWALALGGYGLVEGGTGDLKPDNGKNLAYTSNAWGVGFTMDTNPMTKDLFSYRLNLGFESVTQKPEKGSQLEGNAFNLDNVFTFTLSTDKQARYWMGPLLRLGWSTFTEDDLTTDLSSVGVGLAGGFSYLIGDKIVLSPSLGGLYNMISGKTEVPGDKVDVEGSAWAFYVRVDCLYDF